jgi:hypothetical protein
MALSVATLIKRLTSDETMIGQVESHRDHVPLDAVPQTSFLPRNQNGRLKFMSFSYEGEIAGC